MRIQEANLPWRYLDTSNELLLPWYTRGALEWITSRDTANWRVFEFGGGYSTIWWRLHCRKVDTVDGSLRWAEAMGITYADSLEGYLNYIEKSNELYDCIIVDGEWRKFCVQKAKHYLKESGHIIIDNYRDEQLTEAEWDEVDFMLEGWKKEVFKQHNHTTWKTAIFTKL